MICYLQSDATDNERCPRCLFAKSVEKKKKGNYTAGAAEQ